jgi:hypothetical protein
MVMLSLPRYKPFINGINDEVILGPVVPYLTNSDVDGWSDGRDGQPSGENILAK